MQKKTWIWTYIKNKQSAWKIEDDCCYHKKKQPLLLLLNMYDEHHNKVSTYL